MKISFILPAVLATSLMVAAADKAAAPASPAPEKAPGAPAPATGAAKPAPQVSRRVADVITLSKAGLDVNFIKTYLANAGDVAPPTVNEIVYLRDQGVDQEIITAMVERGGTVRAYVKQVTTQDDRARNAMLDARQRAMFQQSYPPLDRGYYYDAPYAYGFGFSAGPRYRGPFRGPSAAPATAAPAPIPRPPFAVQPLRGTVR